MFVASIRWTLDNADLKCVVHFNVILQYLFDFMRFLDTPCMKFTRSPCIFVKFCFFVILKLLISVAWYDLGLLFIFLLFCYSYSCNLLYNGNYVVILECRVKLETKGVGERERRVCVFFLTT